MKFNELKLQGGGNYSSPSVVKIAVEVEQGFAASNDIEDAFEDAGLNF